jgi:hypothetical protein
MAVPDSAISRKGREWMAAPPQRSSGSTTSQSLALPSSSNTSLLPKLEASPPPQDGERPGDPRAGDGEEVGPRWCAIGVGCHTSLAATPLPSLRRPQSSPRHW